METPKKEAVHAQITDPASGVVYLVAAWRPITRQEAADAIAAFRASNPSVTAKRGEELIVKTIIGLRH